MTKLGFTMTSFVAAIPGAFLCYFLAMFFFQKIDQDVTTILKVLAGFTLFVSFLVTIMPVAILVFFKSAPPVEPPVEDEKDQPKSSSDVVADDVDSFGDEESAELESFESNDEMAEIDSEESSEFDEEDSVAESDDDFFDDDDDDFDFEDD